MLFDAYTLLQIVLSCYSTYNYDLHIMLILACKKYAELVEKFDVKKFFDVQTVMRGSELIHEVCGIPHRINGPAKIVYHNGVIKRVLYLYRNRLHRLHGPALIDYNSDGTVAMERYYTNGMMGSETIPSMISYIDCLRIETYFVNGAIHRTNGPAYIEHDSNGSIIRVIYYKHGIVSRHLYYEPADIKYYPDGKVLSETYYRHGRIHRCNGPAFVKYHSNGKISKEYHYSNGKIHRSNNRPAIIKYNEDGVILYTKYYRKGKCKINNEGWHIV